ncbi:hypothetical protein [Rhodanobacter aciditrophus]|uniref:hypothetical protein n=1 Tax=Rhodanobacter aciditrophus TaxID=1623218 RepID=UPI003CFA18E0
MVVIALLSLYGCAATKPSPPAPEIPARTTAATEARSPMPEILANTTSGGRGTPWGRSDSAEPFMRLSGTATDPTYGLAQGNPIKVGGLDERNEAEYLNGLRGPKGEPVEYERIGSCCPFKTPNAMIEGIGLLDAFRVTYAGQAQPSILYVDFYDTGSLQVPVGFSARKD